MQDYGFGNPDFIQLDVYSSFEKSYSAILERRSNRWKKLNKYEKLSRSYQLKRFCRKGIPSEFRERAWLVLSGASDDMMKNPDMYKNSALIQPPKTFYTTILADLPRTFPENRYFCDTSEEHNLLQSLHRVLSAFAVSFPQIGYCQGLNYVAATILLVMSGTPEEIEEKTFWLLHALSHRIVPSYHANGMVDVQTDCLVFEELLKKKVPGVYRILKDANVDCIVLATKWFICLFSDVLPMETVLRIFDCIFYEGDKILFRACIALVKLHSDVLLKCQIFPDVILAFRNISKDKQTLYCHEFLQSMFNLPGTLSRSRIKKLRKMCKAQVMTKMAELDQRRIDYLESHQMLSPEDTRVTDAVENCENNHSAE